MLENYQGAPLRDIFSLCLAHVLEDHASMSWKIAARLPIIRPIVN